MKPENTIAETFANQIIASRTNLACGADDYPLRMDRRREAQASRILEYGAHAAQLWSRKHGGQFDDGTVKQFAALIAKQIAAASRLESEEDERIARDLE